MEKTRIDIYLVQKGLAPSRTKAQELIQSGLVSLQFGNQLKQVISANELVDESQAPQVILQKNELEKYVSRAGVKLAKALDKVQFNVEGLKILDVGISTGGFTDCLLQRGADSIVGVDVGQNQISPKLKNDPRVKLLEKVNARNLHENPDVLKGNFDKGFHLVVIDVSFISLQKVLPSVLQLVKPWGYVLALVKPQFEVGAENLNKNGIVVNPQLFDSLKDSMISFCNLNGLKVIDYFESALEGKDGNQEFFIYGKRV
jgi:23S rRNA (cytidine1920-2'-O)/16S rRNA (cytidine1409-2'-O)-methyltransferase